MSGSRHLALDGWVIVAAWILLILGAAQVAGDPGLLRDPAAVHERLRSICAEAGLGADPAGCARRIDHACRRAGVPATQPDCWRWLVDNDVAGHLDRRQLVIPEPPRTNRRPGGVRD